MSIFGKLIKNTKIQKTVARLGLKAQKHAPEALVIGGAVLVVGSAVYACKQTLKAQKVLEDFDNDIRQIEECESTGKTMDPESGDILPYSVDDAKSDKKKLYARTGVDLVKCYAAPVLAGTLGLGMMLGAHKILKNRNAALAVAYSNLLTNFNQYQARVKEKLGEEEEFILRSGAVKEPVIFENEDGTEETKDAVVMHDNGTGHSVYARIFDETNSNWSKNPSSNLRFLKMQQNFLNDKLRCEGHLFLNDVYRCLGFKETSEGQLVGWIWDPDNPSHMGDNYVDFGMYEFFHDVDEKREFLNGYNASIWLDFNVDGIVYDLI